MSPRQVRVITYPEGDFVVDENTGEILEWPAGITDKVDWLIGQVLGARSVEKEWASLKQFHSSVLKGYLDDFETGRYVGEHGTAGIVKGRDNRYGDPAKVWSAKEDFELTAEQVTLLLATATRLDLGKVTKLEQDGDIPEGVADAITSGSFGSPWVSVNFARKQPPKMETRLVEGEE